MSKSLSVNNLLGINDLNVNDLNLIFKTANYFKDHFFQHFYHYKFKL